jgi:hypothetical protein
MRRGERRHDHQLTDTREEAMRSTIATGILILALVFTPAAAAKTIKSTIEVTGAGAASGFVSAHGNVVSKRAACLSRRTVRTTVTVAGERVRLPTDVASINGYWGTEAAGDAPDEFRVRMKPKRISKRARCAGDRDTYDFPRAQPRATFPGTIQYFGLSYAGDQVGGEGWIESAKRCLARRKVKVFDFDDGERGPFRASDVSSRNGWWGAHGDSSSQGVRLTLFKKRLGPGRLCEGDVYSYDPAPPP